MCSLDDRGYSRAQFLETAGAVVAFTSLTVVEPAQAAAPGAPPPAAATPDAALARLKAGNTRFAAGTPECGPMTARVAELANGQSPYAVVLGCSDSRVPVETVFDEEPGNLFVVRVAGNFADGEVLGSAEYAVAALKSSFLLVLGHSNCGAVGAAIEFVKNGTKQPGHIQDVVRWIVPAAQATQHRPGSWIDNAVAENVRMTIAKFMSHSTIVADAVKAGNLKIAGAVYDLRTGRVSYV